MRHILQFDFVHSITAHILFIINSAAAAPPLNLTDSSPHPRCSPSWPPGRTMLDRDECRNVINTFQLTHLNWQYTLTHDPFRADQHVILCPYWQFSGSCALSIDFISGDEETLQSNVAALEVLRVVKECVGRSNVDGGSIYLSSGNVQLGITPFRPHNMRNKTISRFRVRPPGPAKRPDGSKPTSEDLGDMRRRTSVT